MIAPRKAIATASAGTNRCEASFRPFYRTGVRLGARRCSSSQPRAVTMPVTMVTMRDDQNTGLIVTENPTIMGYSVRVTIVTINPLS